MFLAKKPGMFRIDQQGEVRIVQYDEAKEFSIGGPVQKRRGADDGKCETIVLE